MLEEQALVVAVDDDGVRVETCRQSACQSCSAKSHCGHSLLGKISKGQIQQFYVSTDLELKPGDQVVLGLGEQAFIKGSALVYLMPLLAMMLMAVIGEQLFGNNSLMSFFLAATGLLSGFLLVRWYSRKNQFNPEYQPVVLRKLPSADSYEVITRSSAEC